LIFFFVINSDDIILMDSIENTRGSIESMLRQQLEKYHCIGGQVRYQPPFLFSLHGVMRDGSERWILLTHRELDILLSQSCEDPDCAGLIIEIDLDHDHFDYRSLSAAEVQAEARELEKRREADAREKLEAKRLELERRTELFGRDLAERIAMKLETRGALGYAHRDYCGMGLEYRDGVWRYGALWDGYMDKPDQQWASRQAFIDWLAKQSDAALANLDSNESFYWGNQTIDRARLEEWVKVDI
jgi:hypothetical protein